MTEAPSQENPPNAEGPAPEEPPSPPRFPVIGVGASAGGLEPLGALLRRLTLSNLALVVIQHLSPNHESLLPGLLARHTAMTVLPAADGLRIQPNHVYVLSPGSDLAILHGVLQLMPTNTQGRPHLPVDFFFRSLAEDRGRLAIGVVLSGTGSDGTFGLKAIKAAGGVTYVQDPSTAQYQGMPRSALESGFTDFSLPVEGIADELVRLSSHPYLAGSQPPATVEGLSKVFLLLRSAFGTDLSQYKYNTVQRRIERRMALNKVESFEDYLRLLQTSPAELGILYRDLLINVTSFFRDGEPFDVLRTSVLPRLLAHKEPGDHLRLWSAGCASGEEAYSLAMVVLEALDGRAAELKVQVFATDLDHEAVATARRGLYPANIAQDVSAERLRRFFVKREDGYEVSRQVRDLVVFATQDLTKDAPFSRLDLVSCRNVLIYLQTVLQKKVLKIIHYALNPRGCLMLGTSETVGDSPDLFTLLDKKNKLYEKRNIAHTAAFELTPGGVAERLRPLSRAPEPRPAPSVQSLADRKVLERYGPPGVVVNQHLEILQFRGQTSAYLEPTPGTASLNLLKLVRPELHLELRALLHKVLTEGAPATVSRLKIKVGDSQRTVSIEVVPITDGESGLRCLLVLFHDPDAARPEPFAEATRPPAALTQEGRLEELERELTTTKEYLQSVVEEMETSNEELKSSNEELQSSNEELQSTNEELETSKEELQSTNEELSTVNDELQTRMEELSQSNDDLQNFLAVVDGPILILGRDLRLRRFTRSAETLFRLEPSDVGKSLAVLRSAAPGLELERLAAQVMDRGAPLEEEFLSDSQRWYRARVVPYLNAERAVRGVIVSMVDVDVSKRQADLVIDTTEYARTVLSAVPLPLLIVDGHLRVVWVNAPFYRQFPLAPEETISARIDELDNGRWAKPELTSLLTDVLTRGKAERELRLTQDGRALKLSASFIPAEGRRPKLVLLSIEVS